MGASSSGGGGDGGRGGTSLGKNNRVEAQLGGVERYMPVGKGGVHLEWRAVRPEAHQLK